LTSTFVRENLRFVETYEATSIEPVRKSVTVGTSPQRAFELFTAHIQEWWPLRTHSVGIDDAVGITFGAGVGAAIVETLANGTTSAWGTVTAWEPPHRVAFTCDAGLRVGLGSGHPPLRGDGSDRFVISSGTGRPRQR
jgi:hypothetical protein